MKKILAFIGALFLTAIPAYSQTSPALLDMLSSPERKKATSQEAYQFCNEETDYNRLYDFGKELAKGWIYSKKTVPLLVKQVKRGTRDEMFSFAFSGLLASNHLSSRDMETNNIIGCWMGYDKIREKLPFTAIHAGFIEHLSPTDKSLFLSLPQR